MSKLLEGAIFVGGPQASAIVYDRAHIEPVIHALCRVTGEDPDDYSATILSSEKRVPVKGEQPPIYYMRDDHSFLRLPDNDVELALRAIDEEFQRGYTHGMLCSKREGFPDVHASGWDGREEFYASCRKVLEEYITCEKDVKHCADTALAKGKDND